MTGYCTSSPWCDEDCCRCAPWEDTERAKERERAQQEEVARKEQAEADAEAQQHHDTH